MTSPAALLVPTADPVADPRLLAAIKDALLQLAWRDVRVTLMVMIALDAWLLIDAVAASEPAMSFDETYLSGAIVNLMLAYSVMFTTLVADRMVARGAKRLPTYAWAIVAGCAVAALAQWGVHHVLHLRTWIDGPSAPYEVIIMQPAMVFFEGLIWAGIIVSIYVNRRTAQLAAARMNVAQMQLAQARRSALESSLQALQARIEPQFLFDTLSLVCALYETNPARGGQTLGDLIDYLRSALPRLRTSGSTLGQELALVRAYVGIMGTHAGEHFAFDIVAPQASRAAPMPAMVLLPLINHVLAKSITSPVSRGTMRVAAHTDAGMLRIEIGTDAKGGVGDALAEPLRDIRERLQNLYGDRARVTVVSGDAMGVRAILEIPHEPPDSNHR